MSAQNEEGRVGCLSGDWQIPKGKQREPFRLVISPKLPESIWAKSATVGRLLWPAAIEQRRNENFAGEGCSCRGVGPSPVVGIAEYFLRLPGRREKCRENCSKFCSLGVTFHSKFHNSSTACLKCLCLHLYDFVA